MVIAWVIPLTILFLSHFSIVHSVRKSNVQVLCETKFSCGLTKKCVKINIDDSVPDSNAVAVDTRPSHRRSQRVSKNLNLPSFYLYSAISWIHAVGWHSLIILVSDGRETHQNGIISSNRLAIGLDTVCDDALLDNVFQCV